MAVRARQHSRTCKLALKIPILSGQGRLRVFVCVPASQSCALHRHCQLSCNVGRHGNLQGFQSFFLEKSQQEFDSKRDFVALCKWGRDSLKMQHLLSGFAVHARVLQLMSHWLAAPRAWLEQSAGAMMGTATSSSAPTGPGRSAMCDTAAWESSRTRIAPGALLSVFQLQSCFTSEERDCVSSPVFL